MADQKETGKGIEIRKGRKRGLEGRKIEDTAGKGQRGGVEISIEKRILLIGFLKSEKDLKEISAWNCKRGIFGWTFRDGKGKLTGKDRNKLQNERGPVVRSYLETKATFIQAAGIQRTDTSLLGGKPVSAAARSFRAAGYFLKKEKKRSGFRIQQGKNSDMKNLQKEKRDVAR